MRNRYRDSKILRTAVFRESLSLMSRPRFAFSVVAGAWLRLRLQQMVYRKEVGADRCCEIALSQRVPEHLKWLPHSIFFWLSGRRFRRSSGFVLYLPAPEAMVTLGSDRLLKYNFCYLDSGRFPATLRTGTARQACVGVSLTSLAGAKRRLNGCSPWKCLPGGSGDGSGLSQFVRC